MLGTILIIILILLLDRRAADVAVFDRLGLLSRRRPRPDPDHRHHVGPCRKNLAMRPAKAGPNQSTIFMNA